MKQFSVGRKAKIENAMFRLEKLPFIAGGEY
jgi:hypothetical protein